MYAECKSAGCEHLCSYVLKIITIICFLFCTTWLVTSLDKSSFLFPFVSTIYPYYAAFQLSYLIRFRILGASYPRLQTGGEIAVLTCYSLSAQLVSVHPIFLDIHSFKSTQPYLRNMQKVKLH